MLHSLMLMAVGYVLGAFTPAVGRKIKALFVKEAKVAEGSAIAKKIESKL
ncbi:Uncharacterised protein [uncultured archaeon]|nr:Uncharacterised protein [uncultured archaeon]